MTRFRRLGLSGLMLALAAAGAAGQTNAPGPRQASGPAAAELRQLLKTCFSQWHRGSAGSLGLGEVNAAMANPQVRGNEAAAAVLVRRWLENDPGRATNGVSLAQLQELAEDPQANRRFFQLRDHIWRINRSVNRTLFLAQDPNFLSFHQGKLQDCYFLAVVAGFIGRDYRQVQYMIHPAQGGYGVSFPNGRSVFVPELTDAELLLGASVGADHGVWLSVLEKAYGLLRQQRWEERQRDVPAAASGAAAKGRPPTVAELVGHGGASGPVMALFSGHRPTGVHLDEWLQEDGDKPGKAANRLHLLLTELARTRRLITVAGAGYAPSSPLPPAIITNHVFAVLGYKTDRRAVTLFNPWGNNFTPGGTPGLANGYTTRHGVFEMPVREFIQVFSRMDYETTESARF